MQITFSRAEFFTLAALMRAGGIIGLDPSRLLPEAAAERQTLYQAGERSLVARGLLRVSGNDAQLEEGVQRMLEAVVHPQAALVSVKTQPEVGQQLFMHYGQAGGFVEQTLPNDQTHRLADVGDAAALRERLLQVFPLPGGADGGGFELDTAAMLAAYNFIRSGDTAEGLAALGQNGPVGAAHRGFLASIAGLQFSGTLSLIQIRPDEESEAREIALVCGEGRAWLVVGEDNGKSQIGAIDAAGFARVLDTLLAAVMG